MNKETLIENPKNIRPHVVLLGAGASKAAFPNGEATGKHLPLMQNFIETLDLTSTLRDASINFEGNFEAVYASIENEALKKTIEQKINNYFSTMELPVIATDYDRLLLSLRSTDAIFTFNWDPFLFDAYQRNYGAGISLPNIFFLHGNVRIGACVTHTNEWGIRNLQCPNCKETFTNIPLLYPIEKKDYSKDAYIKSSWDSAEEWFANAFTLTIFGYGAPSSDVDAVKLLKSAWLKLSTRQLEHIEIIDTANTDILIQRWSEFAPTNHYRVINSLNDSRLLRWPRRSCESLFYPMTEGEACEEFPLSTTNNLNELHKHIKEIAKHEK